MQGTIGWRPWRIGVSARGTDRAVRSQEVVESDTFRFYQAAAIHRTFVLRDLLPTHRVSGQLR